MKTKEQLTEEIQKECHKMVERIMKHGKKITHQDATNVYLFHKLAEIELRLQELAAHQCYDSSNIQ